MYRIDDIGGLFASLPPNLQNAKNEAYCYALDRLFQKTVMYSKKIGIWTDIKNTESKWYDYMATCIRTPYYRSDYSDEQKRKLIEGTLLTYKYAGSRRAVENMLINIFGEARFVPWYEYEGEPYHFKVVVSKKPSKEDKDLFTRMLKRVKSAREIIDEVDIITGKFEAKWYIGMAMEIIKEEIIFNGEGGT